MFSAATLPMPLPEPPGSAPPTVLLVDDSPNDLRPLVDMLAHTTMRLLVAFDGQDGVDKAVLHLPDLILLDVTMPRMDGFAACRQLKALPRTQGIPVIFLTAADDLASRLQGLTLGGVDYISKPFNEHEALARMRIHLDISRRLRDGARIAQAGAAVGSAAPGAGQPGPAARIGGAGDPGTPAVQAVRRDELLVCAATTYLRQHLATPPTADVLAHLVGTNERRLGQAFHAQFGMAVFDWLREERMRQACQLLTATDTAVGSIGDYLGFSTPANFAKAFRERFGMSPRTLRLQQQQQRHRDRAEQQDTTALLPAEPGRAS